MTEHQTTVPPAGQATPSTGTLLFLYGERVAPPAGVLGGTVVPYHGVKVSTEDLAVTVLAASIWGLRQAGLLQLQEVTQKALGMIKQQHVQLTMVGSPALRTGYDDLVLRGVASGATTAHDVVYRWFGGDVVDPAGQVLGVANDEMVTLGLAAAVDAGRGAIGGWLRGNTRIEPDRDRIAALWPAFEQAAAGWQYFRQSEPALAETLLDSCRKALRNRRDTD